MNRALAITAGLVIMGLVGFGTYNALGQTPATTLFDGKDLSAFNVLGDANWQIVDGVVQANQGTGYLVTKGSYTDFQINLDFWVDEDANSGVFIRCSNPQQVNGNNSYEVNINDKRPDQRYRTGGIVNVASPSSVINTGGKWNTFEITARGPRLIVILNGTRVVDAEHSGHARGPIALQYSAGTVKFRNVVIRTL
jgi:hypothetical protein